MEFKKDNTFFSGRIKSIGFATKGAYKLLTTEHSIMVQSVLGLCTTVLGFYLNISQTEWLAQTLAIGLVLCTEGLNTAIEKMADFVQPNFDPKIGFIKDIAAGSVFFAAMVAFAIWAIIYVPRLLEIISSS